MTGCQIDTVLPLLVTGRATPAHSTSAGTHHGRFGLSCFRQVLYKHYLRRRRNSNVHCAQHHDLRPLRDVERLVSAQSAVRPYVVSLHAAADARLSSRRRTCRHRPAWRHRCVVNHRVGNAAEGEAPRGHTFTGGFLMPVNFCLSGGTPVRVNICVLNTAPGSAGSTSTSKESFPHLTVTGEGERQRAVRPSKQDGTHNVFLLATHSSS
jgi:hypothetical protein